MSTASQRSLSASLNTLIFPLISSLYRTLIISLLFALYPQLVLGQKKTVRTPPPQESSARSKGATPPSPLETPSIKKELLRRAQIPLTSLKVERYSTDLWVACGSDAQTEAVWPIVILKKSGQTWSLSDRLLISLDQRCTSTDEGASGCSHFRSYTIPPKLCETPSLGVSYRLTLPHGEGAEVHAVILNATPTKSDSWSVIWRGVIASEVHPSAHAESFYSRSQLDKSIAVPSSRTPSERPQRCAPLTVKTQQGARSFHRVDAREREFDGLEIDLEQYRFRGDRYHLIEEVEEEIKIRSK